MITEIRNLAQTFAIVTGLGASACGTLCPAAELSAKPAIAEPAPPSRKKNRLVILTAKH